MKKSDKPVTQNEFYATLRRIFDEYSQFVIDKIDTKNKKYRDDILTGQDKIMKRLDNLDADNAAGLLQGRRLILRVDNHEKRISSLESKN